MSKQRFSDEHNENSSSHDDDEEEEEEIGDNDDEEVGLVEQEIDDDYNNLEEEDEINNYEDEVDNSHNDEHRHENELTSNRNHKNATSTAIVKQGRREEERSMAGEGEIQETNEASEKNQTNKKKKVHQLSLKTTEDFNAKLKKRGVIYIARIPPKMTPTKMKQIMLQFGEVTRIYFAKEDASIRKRRKQITGNACTRYKEGWIEFTNKDIAKQVALALHQTPISNHKRNVHCNELWMLKYLSKFQWSFLTERVAYERRMREQKIRLETLQARKETAAYKHLVDMGQKIDKIEQRRKRKAQMIQQKQQVVPEHQQNAVPESRNTNEDGTSRQQTIQRMKKKIGTVIRQLQPIEDGTEKSSKRVLLGSLV